MRRACSKPLEPLDLREGEEVQVDVRTSEGSVARRFYGIAKKRRSELSRDELLKVIEEIGNENLREFQHDSQAHEDGALLRLRHCERVER